MSIVSPPLCTVTELTQQIKTLLEAGFTRVWVVGEITGCKKAGSGHVYLTLRDAGAILPGVIWRNIASRLMVPLQDGVEIVAAGALSVYAPHGEYRLVIDEVQLKGQGAQELALRQLKEKLARLGYFDPRRKKPLPRFPRRLVLVTSPTGATVRDMLEILGRRWPLAEVWISPVRVQGPGAREEIAAALDRLRGLADIDVVILGRGGGSSEDLSAFNEEMVARAIFDCPIPVISAVGHEIDVTLADLVADRRALTPSEAAEISTPDRWELASALHARAQRLRDLLNGRVQAGLHSFRGLANRRVFLQPLERLRDLERRLDDCQQRLQRAMRQRLVLARQALGAGAGQLESLSPLNVLARGYSLTRTLNDQRIVRATQDVEVGDWVETRLHEGTLLCRVEEVLEKGSE